MGVHVRVCMCGCACEDVHVWMCMCGCACEGVHVRWGGGDITYNQSSHLIILSNIHLS